MTAGSSPLITAEEISFAYGRSDGSELIFEAADFSVSAGQIVAIVGQSGGGKTTLLRLIAGFLSPLSGRLRRHQDCAGAVTFHPQQSMVLPWLKVRANILLGQRFQRYQHEVEYNNVVASLKLGPLMGRYPSTLSGGQLERVALARSLVTPGKLLLLDEPLAGTDYMLRTRIEDYLRVYVKRTGTSVVIVTHDLPQALALSDAILTVPAQARSVGRFEIPPDVLNEWPSRRRESAYIGPAVRDLALALEPATS